MALYEISKANSLESLQSSVDSHCDWVSKEDAELHSFIKVIQPELSFVPENPVVFSAKDIFEIQGYPTSFGIKPAVITRGNITAPLIDTFVNHGGIYIGQNNLDPCCASGTGKNPFFGDVVNPLDPSLPCYGSSSGSAAAVAARFVNFSIGSDSGGSIRIPAAALGLIGVKFSSNSLDDGNTLILDSSFDSLGMIVDNSETLTWLISVLNPDLPTRLPQRQKIKILIPAECSDVELLNAIEVLDGDLQIEIEKLAFPFTEALDLRKILVADSFYEFCLEHSIALEKLPEQAKALAFLGKQSDAAQLSEALAKKESVGKQIKSLLGPCCVIMTPTLPAQEQPELALNHYLGLANLCDLPAISIPVAGYNSLQIIGNDRGLYEIFVLASLLHSRLN